MSALDRAIRTLHEPRRPSSVSWQIDIEIFPDGVPRPIGTVFLVNGACPLACVYCGLYRQMADRPATGEEIAAQIEVARRAMPDVAGLKIYNASSLFEPASIRQTAEDLVAIARSLDGLDLAVVEARAENAHRAENLSARISGQLEVAIGLEVADDRLLALLNKPTTVERYRRAARTLNENGVSLRSFVLVAPPFVPVEETIPMAVGTFELARECGSRVVSFLPVVSSHAPMRRLAERGYFSSPSLDEVFRLVAACVDRGPVVLAETAWAGELPACPSCRGPIMDSLRAQNERGTLLAVNCADHNPPERSPVKTPNTIGEVAEALT